MVVCGMWYVVCGMCCGQTKKKRRKKVSIQKKEGKRKVNTLKKELNMERGGKGLGALCVVREERRKGWGWESL